MVTALPQKFPFILDRNLAKFKFYLKIILKNLKNWKNLIFFFFRI